MPLADGEVIAGYTILRSLGAGGMGEVYLAQHPRLPRRDALKVLSASVCSESEYRQRFNREADIAATLWHPHIVEVHDRGDVDGQLWISMDYVEGTDAGRLLAERYPDGMPADDVVRIVTAVADALDYAHQRGLLHRDVKPASLGPVFDKALAKSPNERYDRCIDFARALAHHIGTENQQLSADATMLAHAATGPRHAKAQSKPRRRVIFPVAIMLVVIAVAAIGFVLFDRMRDRTAEAKPHSPSAPSAPASPGNVTLPVVVVGAKCATLGAAAITEGGTPAYCAHLPTTNATIWSLYPGEISSPTATAGPNDEVYPSETESPVLVCMEQTGQSRLDCHDDILQSNATATAPPSP
jgi:hypothetical protein